MTTSRRISSQHMMATARRKPRKTSPRKVLVQDLRLAVTSKFVANGDPAVFNTSGFIPVLTERAAQVPLSPNIRSMDRGPVRNQIMVWLKAIRDALSHELGYTTVTNGTFRPTGPSSPPIQLKNMFGPT